MGRLKGRPLAEQEIVLAPQREVCVGCGQFMRVAYTYRRTVVRMDGLWRLVLRVRRCGTAGCVRYHQACGPEEAGAWALPQSEFGLDVIAQIGHWRSREHRSVPQMHQALRERGVDIAERSVTELLYRYEELVALRLSDPTRLRERLAGQGGVILAMDGLQPDVGHEVLWVLRDVRSGEVLLARSLLSAAEGDLAPLLEEVRDALAGRCPEDTIPIQGVISDGQHSIRKAVARTLPGVPHQLCQFHYLREAARPIFEADRHAKKELKKRVRGVRPIERALEGRADEEVEAIRGYCLAIRSALTDDGRPPLAASGLTLKGRLEAVATSLERVEQVARTHAAESHDGKRGKSADHAAAAPRAERAGRDGDAVAPDPDRLQLRPPRSAPVVQSRPAPDDGPPTDLPAAAGRSAHGSSESRPTGRGRRPFPHGHGELLARIIRLLCPARPAAYQQRPGAVLRLGPPSRTAGHRAQRRLAGFGRARTRPRGSGGRNPPAVTDARRVAATGPASLGIPPPAPRGAAFYPPGTSALPPRS